jgi:hypothetical protein
MSWPSTEPPAPKSGAISRPVGTQIPTIQTMLATSRNAVGNERAGASLRETLQRPECKAPLEHSHTGCSLPPRAHIQAHRLERLEPYEGKLSRTVLRGGRAGNSPPLLGEDEPRGESEELQSHAWLTGTVPRGGQGIGVFSSSK